MGCTMDSAIQNPKSRIQNGGHWGSPVRLLVRIFALAAAVCLAIGGPLPVWSARIVPGLSPLVVLADSVTQRGWYTGLFWALPPCVVLAAAVARGRWFCRWLCPAGTVYTAVSRVGLRRPFCHWRLNGYIFWAIVWAALAGAPLYLFLDPLSTFGRMAPWARGIHTAAALVPGLILPVFALLSLVQPMVWCTHFCPLGYLVERAQWRRRPLRELVDRERRQFLAGLAVGLLPAVLLRRVGWAATAGASRGAVLPPGALAPADFAAVCTRCYACVKVCPTRILRVSWPPWSQPLAYFQPAMDANHGACEEFCTACTRVCPTGAIRRLTPEQKRRRQIGTARVRRSACLAWADGQHCMVCDEFCPYHAIDTIMSPTGIPQPQVDPHKCRGCGFCQNQCPAVRAGKAIIVEGIAPQREVVPAAD